MASDFGAAAVRGPGSRPAVAVLLVLCAGAAAAVTVPGDPQTAPAIAPAALDPALVDAIRGNLAQGLPTADIEPDVLHAIATGMYREGQVQLARNGWEQAAARDPNLPGADLMLDLERLTGLLVKSDTSGAQALLAEMEKRHAADPHFHLVRGEQALRASNLAAAEAAYTRARELGPKLVVAALALGRLREVQGRHDEARSLYLEATTLAPKHARAWAFLGSHQFRGGERDAALTSFRQARELDRRQPPPAAQMARLSAEARDYIGARHWYRAALADAREGQQVLQLALIDVLLELRLHDEARREIEAALSVSESPQLLGSLAYLDERQGRDADAERRYRRALELAPEAPAVRNNLAMLLIRTGREGTEALDLTRAALAVAPDNALVRGTHACALVVGNALDEARKALPEAVRRNPADAWIRYCYGRLLVRDGNMADARIQLEGALLLDPQFPRRAAVEEMLKKQGGP